MYADLVNDITGDPEVNRFGALADTIGWAIKGVMNWFVGKSHPSRTVPLDELANMESSGADASNDRRIEIHPRVVTPDAVAPCE
jgi:hypothetical protein